MTEFYWFGVRNRKQSLGGPRAHLGAAGDSRMYHTDNYKNNITGRSILDILTPDLVVMEEAFNKNMAHFRSIVSNRISHRPHCKMHKSSIIAQKQLKEGNSKGVCCQTLSEAEVLSENGIKDIFITNQIVNKNKINILSELNKYSYIKICVDNANNIKDINEISKNKGIRIDLMIEINCGGGRCGVNSYDEFHGQYKLIEEMEHVNFKGVQAYNGSSQHVYEREERHRESERTYSMIREYLRCLDKENHEDIEISGGGTGTLEFDIESGLFTETQAGSYLFMDMDYARVAGDSEKGVGGFDNSLFVITSVISKPSPEIAVCDAGLKSHSVDSGYPLVHGDTGLTVIGVSDNHCVVKDESNSLNINDRILLIPGHCDPTCNLYDRYLIINNDAVSDIWDIDARGRNI
ncbi:DSD1 family PLP-dependent enzyme [Fodinicurvata sediminis]|uniref:DSD1 family PLP-dependent enzyme n=1 Tax=Fodinicurvata sediminis TaxID=1121832 RepID=UPI00138AE697|nr:DSD1 family PLP-dependent enzyme [Fodinicurvata sediminis]